MPRFPAFLIPSKVKRTVSRPIILASSSPFRRELLQRLHLDFSSISPDIDETRLEGEIASNYVTRLAVEKARKVANEHPEAIVIGSDQCAVLDEDILGKPGSHENAMQQLRNAQGKTVIFQTGICVICLDSAFQQQAAVPFEVDFRQLSDQQLDRYLTTERPYNCAGSFKSEAYGITLFERMRGADPTALIGLPLIALTRMLEEAGVSVV